MRRKQKMAKTRNRIKKMNFQTRERIFEELEPLSENDKYIIEMAGYRKETVGQADENISRIVRGNPRPQYI
jgi:hypothetical protein